jgi:proteasome lid subunit RPN8/RPN11
MDEHKVEPCASVDSEVTWSDLGECYSPEIRSLEELLPENDLSKPDRDAPFWLFFEESAHERMFTDACKDMSREHGGILTGQAYKDIGGNHYVLVTNAIAATDSQGTSTHLQFTAESWKPVWDYLQTSPEVKIIGWYHTHPGLGVFLSGTDLRTQRLYFSAPWNVAVVIDPIANRIGYFFGSDGKRVKVFRKFTKGEQFPEAT